MKVEILMSCMHQEDATLITESNITGNVVVINQCDKEDYSEYKTAHGIAKMYSTVQRGLTKSRNMAIDKSDADVCMLCDDDEKFVEGYEAKITEAYKSLPQADLIVFKMINRPVSFSDKVQRLKFPKIMKVSSVQISFRRCSLVNSSVYFDELLGAGSGNGAEEELKFLSDCLKAGLRIYYVPVEIADIGQISSTWFDGFNEDFFEKRGATTRYILGAFLASVYAIYYVVFKYKIYKSQISFFGALSSVFRGIKNNRISKLAKEMSGNNKEVLY